MEAAQSIDQKIEKIRHTLERVRGELLFCDHDEELAVLDILRRELLQKNPQVAKTAEKLTMAYELAIEYDRIRPRQGQAAEVLSNAFAKEANRAQDSVPEPVMEKLAKIDPDFAADIQDTNARFQGMGRHIGEVIERTPFGGGRRK